MDKLMTQLRGYPVYYWTEKILSILFTGYIPTSKEAPLFYIGPMNATISGNTLEGPRLRAGGLPHGSIRTFSVKVTSPTASRTNG